MPILRGILPWRSTQNRTKVTRTVLYSHGCAVWPVIEGDDSTRFDYERIHKNGQVVRNELIDTARHGTTWHDMARQLHHHPSFHKFISQTIAGIDVCRFAFQYSFPIDSWFRKDFGNLCMWFVAVILSVPKKGRTICRNIGR